MRNKLSDLQNYLFAQLERLDEEQISQEELEKEINRTKAITSLANTIIANGSLALQAQKFIDDRNNSDTKLPEMLE